MVMKVNDFIAKRKRLRFSTSCNGFESGGMSTKERASQNFWSHSNDGVAMDIAHF